MAQLSARQVARAALRLWRKQQGFADSVISQLLADSKLSESDRAFAQELFYGVLRNLALLDFWIGCLRSGPIEHDLRDLLRLGLYQLFQLGTAPHAAVHETVSLAPKRQRTIVNAILRSAARRRSELLAQAQRQPLPVRTSHPQFLVERWQQRFGANRAEKLCEWDNAPAPVYARINRLKTERENFLRLYPEARPVPRHSDFVQFNGLPAQALETGRCYIQDPSTAVACRLLNPEPGEKILDACAAPGGKTAYIAQLMKNRGAIVACDRAPDRIRLLRENVARLGVTIARVVRHDWTQAAVPKTIVSLAPFDRILVDAPCTNTGVLRRRVDARWRLSPADFLRMQKQQITLTRALLPLLKAQGVFVYSTCSLEPEENEQVVRRLLADWPGLRLEQEQWSLPFRDGFDGAYAAKLVRTTQESAQLHPAAPVE